MPYLESPRGAAADIKGQSIRRILRKIAANEHDQLASISMLADPSVAPNLGAEQLNR